MRNWMLIGQWPRVLKSWPRLTRKNHVDQPANLGTQGVLKPQSDPLMAAHKEFFRATGRQCKNRHGQLQHPRWIGQWRVHLRRKLRSKSGSDLRLIVSI